MSRSKFNELKNVFKTLHGPKGCLWDKKQTHKSLVADLKEEVEEFIDTVNKNDPEHMKEELGDLLLHVMFNAQIASKNKKFDIEDVIEGLIRKLKRRHPHVFGDTKVKSASQIIRNWNKIKKLEEESKLRRI
jgi:tetrapyrrole methylase family protein/MazG family protein